MKILIVRPYPSYMEVKRRTYNIQELGLAKALVRKGHVCDILFWTDKEETDVTIPVDEANVTVYYRKALTFLKNAIYLRARDLYGKYDIIQSSEYNQFESLRLAALYPRKTVIYHGPYYSSFNKRYNAFCKVFDFLFLWLYKKNDTRFITKSNLACEYLTSKGIKKEVIDTVGVGIDEESLLCEKTVINEVSQRIEKDAGVKLLYIGKLEPRRNIFFLIDLLEALEKQISDVTLYLIGSGDDAYVKEVQNSIKTRRLEEKVVWASKVEQNQLERIYRSADIFLLPSEYEIFGMVLLEAMYYGKVVLTTYNGGSDMIIQDGVNGFIVSQHDKDSWIRIIKDYSIDKDKYYSIQNKATKNVKTSFLWDSLVDSFVQAYEKVMQND